MTQNQDEAYRLGFRDALLGAAECLRDFELRSRNISRPAIIELARRLDRLARTAEASEVLK